MGPVGASRLQRAREHLGWLCSRDAVPAVGDEERHPIAAECTELTDFFIGAGRVIVTFEHPASIISGNTDLGGESDERVRVVELLYVPRGNLQAYRNVGEGVGRMLVSQTPGGLHERFFEEIGEERRDGSTPPVSEDPPDTQRIARIAAGERHLDAAPRPLVRRTGRAYRMNASELLVTTGRGSLAEGEKGGSSVFARTFTIEGRRERFAGFARVGQEKVLPALQGFDGFEGLLVLAKRHNGKILMVTL